MAVPHVLDLFSLKGKTAVLTGATGGIGVQISLALAEAGADIISLELPNDRLAPELRRIIEPTGRSLKSFECNIRNSQSIKDCFAEMWRAGVVPDILVNLAGITNHNSVEGTRVEDLDAVMEINFRGTFLAAQEFGKELLRLKRPGKIINFSSMAAWLVQTNIPVYSSSKAAVSALTRAISNEWASKGITCNAICPGFVRTGMCTDLASDQVFSDKVEARTATGRWGTPEDLKGLAVYLASSASDFMSGESIVIDGGVIGL